METRDEELAKLIDAYVTACGLDSYGNLCGACASVGIEHGRSTIDELLLFLRDWNERRS